MRPFHAIPAIVLTCTLAASSATQARPKYAYTVLPLGAGWGSYATAINNAGNIAGRLTPGAGEHGFLYANGVLTDLGTLPGYDASVASGINMGQQVVGSSFRLVITAPMRGFVYSGGKMRDIGSLAGDTTAATDINDAGDIVGQSVLQEHFGFAFLYRDGLMRNLGSLPGSDRSGASAINNGGQIAGSSGVGPSQGPNGNQTHAVLWENGYIKDLGTLGGLYSHGEDINDRGQVVGYSTLAGRDEPRADYRGFIWSKGKMRDLGTPPGGKHVRALAVNTHGDIVGVYQGTCQRAFLYGYHGKMHDLTSLVDPAEGWTITIAYDINDAGQIVGEACRQPTFCTAVRLDPLLKEGRHGDGANGEDERAASDEATQLGGTDQ